MTLHRLMLRGIVVAAVVAAACLAGSSSALATAGFHRFPSVAGPATLPAGVFCAFYGWEVTGRLSPMTDITDDLVSLFRYCVPRRCLLAL